MRVLLGMTLLFVGLVACSPDAPLANTGVQPAAITPNQDGDADVARLTYSIGRPATVSITFVGADASEHMFRDERLRSPGDYEALFGGAIDGRVLADGVYEVRFDVTPLDGTPEQSRTHTLSIAGGDTVPPRLAGLAVRPGTFTPNQDGIGDRVAISYRLDEPAEVRVWLETADGEYVTDILEDLESAEHPGEPGSHVYDYDAGVDADAPPPADGDYLVVAEARDPSGNVHRESVPLVIRDGGQPRAAMVGDVEWSDTVVPLGATLSFTVSVRNTGGTPIRTRGPEPGIVYDNTDSFNQTAPAEVLLLARSGDRTASLRVPADGADGRRVVLDLDSSGGSTPGDALSDAPGDAPDDALGDGHGSTVPDVEEQAPVSFCGTVTAGEQVVPGAQVYAFEADGDNGTLVVTAGDGTFCFQDLEIPPAFERTTARSPGSIRLGLEYDELGSSIAYPFRWQLGDTESLDVCEVDGSYYLCLAPGSTVTVNGGVRFVEPPFRRSTNVYLALMHEDVRRMHGPYDPQRITIEY